MSQSTRLRVFGAGALLLASGLVFLGIRDAQARERSASSGQIAGSERTRSAHFDRSRSPTKRSRATSPRRDPEAWLAEVLARNPGLEPVWRDIPDHENGFLQWLEFVEKYQVNGESGSEKLEIPSDVAAILSDPAKWDKEIIEAFLAENQDLLETITRIGLLPGQSVAGIDLDRWGFVGGRLAKQSTDLLLADARLAAESGDPERALRRVQAASGLARHHNQVEAASVLMETVSILLRTSMQDQVMNHILAALDSTPGEIARWREAIRPPNMELSGLSSVFLGEGWLSLGAFVIPGANGDLPLPSKREIPDPDALLDYYAQGYLGAAKRAQVSSLDDLIGGEDRKFVMPVTADHLSEEAEEMLSVMAIDLTAWSRGWVRGMVLSARADAALAILQGEVAPLEPFTGQPFVYDSEARTVQVPDDPRLRSQEMNIGSPLQLP